MDASWLWFASNNLETFIFRAAATAQNPAVDSRRVIRHHVLAVISSDSPSPKTQQARPVREMRLRSASVEGSVSGVWGRVWFNGRGGMNCISLFSHDHDLEESAAARRGLNGLFECGTLVCASSDRYRASRLVVDNQTQATRNGHRS